MARKRLENRCSWIFIFHFIDLFSLISDRDGCVDEQRLGALLYECVLIPRNLGETGQFGNEDFNQYVKTCFQQVRDQTLCIGNMISFNQ